MSRFKNTKYLNAKSDAGAALALVLVMIVFLSLWMASVAVLTQSTRSAIKTNVAQSNHRSDLVSGALAYALQQLTYDGNGANRRWGTDLDPNKCSDKTVEDPSKPGNLLSYPPAAGTKLVGIQCVEAKDSGKQFPVASYVLTGNNDSCTSGSCVIGQDSGLYINNASAPCPPAGTQLQVGGGIINSSGVWGNNVSCGTLQLVQRTIGSTPQITQPDGSIGCPVTSTQFSNAGKLATGVCTCPETSFLPLNGTNTYSTTNCSKGVLANSISLSDSSSDLRAYADSVGGGLGVASGVATSTSGSNCSGTDSSSYGTPVVLWYPGTLHSAQIEQLNAQIAACNTVPIVFTAGVYRFVPDTVNPNNAKTCASTPSSSTGTSTNSTACANQVNINNVKADIIGGTPVGIGGTTAAAPSGNLNAQDCSPTAAGVEFQFAGYSYINFTRGLLALCSNNSNPVISAPLNSTATDFYLNYEGSSAFLTMANGTNSGAVCSAVCLLAHGLVYAPAGWADISLNGTSVASFGNGAMFMAMTLSETGSVNSGGQIDPPPPFNGDRVVQLRFWDLVNGRDLGLVQVVIKDYYGRRLASGYRILTWRTLW